MHEITHGERHERAAADGNGTYYMFYTAYGDNGGSGDRTVFLNLATTSDPTSSHGACKRPGVHACERIAVVMLMPLCRLAAVGARVPLSAGLQERRVAAARHAPALSAMGRLADPDSAGACAL